MEEGAQKLNRGLSNSLHRRQEMQSQEMIMSITVSSRAHSSEVNKNDLLGGQFLIFLSKNPGK